MATLIEEMVLETRATSAAGIAAKLRMIRDLETGITEGDDLEHQLFASALADAERLLGRGVQ
ncbi:hypothetical protein WCLP8_4770001 [uncultured Gammaproteobacteria bacterium]